MSPVYALLATAVLATFVVLAGVTTYRYVRRDLLHPVVLVNGIIAYFVLVPAAYLLATGMTVVPTRFGLTNPERALAIALVVLLGMYVVILAAFHRVSRYETSSVDRLSKVFADVNSGVVLILGLIGFGAGLLSFGYYVVVNGGPVRLFTVTPRTAFQTISNTYRFRILGLIGVLGGYSTVLCALRPTLERYHNRRQELPVRALALVATVTFLTMLISISTRVRMAILVPALIAIVYFRTVGWLPRRTLLGIGTVVVGAGIGFSAIEGLINGFQIEAVIDVLINGVIQTPRLVLMMVLTERVPSEVFFQFGATLPEAFYLDLPGLPRYGNIVERIATGVDKENHLASAMLPGELWLNFGPIGILVGGVIYGAMLRWAYRLRDHAQPLIRGIQPAVFVCVLLLWPTNLTWGVQLLFIRILAPVLVAVVVAFIIQRKFPRLVNIIYGEDTV